MPDLPASPAVPARWRLGDWLIEPARNSLRTGNGQAQEERTLEPRVMAVLEVLLRHGGEPVSDPQLLAEVWPGVAVSDASVYQAIAQLRKALGDSGKPYRYVGRVSGKGYFLVQPAQRQEDPALAPARSPGGVAMAAPTMTEPAMAEPAPPAAPAQAPEQVPEQAPEQVPGQPSGQASATGLPAQRPPLGRWLVAGVALGVVVAAVWLTVGDTPTPPAVRAGDHAAMPPARATAAPEPNLRGHDAHPDSPGWDDYLQGRWLWNQRKIELLAPAADHYRAAIAKDPTLALAYVGLCDVFHFQHLYGDWPLQKVLAQCEPLLRDALQREPQLGAALASFGLLKLSQGEWQAAETYLDRAVALNPNDAMAWMWSADVVRQRGDLAGALTRMQKAETLDPLSPIIKRSYVLLLLNLGQFADAQKMFAEALLLEADYADRPVDEIELLPLTVERAVAFIRWAERFPDRSAIDNPKRGLGVQTNLAMVYLAVRDFDRADRALRHAEASEPHHPYVQLIRAIWWRGQGEGEKALALLQQRAARFPNNAFFAQVALLQLAELGRLDEARQQFAERFPDYRDALRPPLQEHNLRLILSGLWLLTPAERRALAPAIDELLQRAPQPERLALNLRLLVADQPSVEAELSALLAGGALMSPADDYLLPEVSPLWQNLDAALLRQLDRNRAQVRQQLAQ